MTIASLFSLLTGFGSAGAAIVGRSAAKGRMRPLLEATSHPVHTIGHPVHAIGNPVHTIGHPVHLIGLSPVRS
jgi:hypothetical protein